MKILFIGKIYPTEGSGGAENMFRLHAETMAQRGHEVHVLSFGEKEYVSVDNCHIIQHRVRIKNIYSPFEKTKRGFIEKIIWHLIDIYNPLHRKYLSTLCDSVQPDVVVCENISGWSPYVWHFFKGRGIPVFQFVHDLGLICGKSVMYKNHKPCSKICGSCKLLTLCYKVNEKKVDKFLFVSHAIENKYIEQGFDSKKCEVVYNREKIALTTKTDIWGKSHTSFTIGLMAALSEHKGVLKLIEAFKLLKGDFRLRLAGRPISEDFRVRLEQEIGKDNRIELVGHVSPDIFYPQVDLAVLPSIWFEAFGLVAMEACAHQVPAIVSYYGGMTEIIRENQNGMYCNPSDAHSIAEKIQYLYDNPEVYYGMMGRAHESILPYIDIDQMGQEIENIIVQ